MTSVHVGDSFKSSVEVVSLQLARELGVFRSSTFTNTKSNACFLVGIISIISHISVVSTPKTAFNTKNTNKH